MTNGSNPMSPPISQPKSPPSPSGQATVVFLGTGTSVGVPALGCKCDVCKSADPKNNRTRSAVLFQLANGNLLVDTPPDLRQQLLREHIDLVHGVLFTHEHADHIFGLDDLRLFPFRLGAPVPLYCQSKVEERIRRSYDYAFCDREPTHPGAKPQLEIHTIDHRRFQVLGAEITPIPMTHGPHFDVLGFRVGDFAYCTDTNGIPDSSLELLQGLQTFVIGALRFKPHPTHFNLDEAIEVARRLKPKRTLLTHLSHDLDHGPVSESLPEGIELAFDGLRVPLRLSP